MLRSVCGAVQCSGVESRILQDGGRVPQSGGGHVDWGVWAVLRWPVRVASAAWDLARSCCCLLLFSCMCARVRRERLLSSTSRHCALPRRLPLA